jgi:hypothetical protein
VDCGEWIVESGEWRVGEWRVVSGANRGECRVESGECRVEISVLWSVVESGDVECGCAGEEAPGAEAPELGITPRIRLTKFSFVSIIH